jgi:flagellar biosynthesis anti-sigma factor FlgM
MSLRIENQGQSVNPSMDLKSTSTPTGAANSSAQSMPSSLDAAGATSDTASISAATSQLSGDVAIRQDRVDSLRAQVESGTYTVDARAVATAMFQNLLRS